MIVRMDKFIKFTVLFVADNQLVKCCFKYVMNNLVND